MRIAWLTDQHFPFEDRRAWLLALRISADFEPHAVPICSDDRDFYSVSHFDKDPARVKNQQADLDYWHKRMVEMKDILQPGWRDGKGRNIYYRPILGNHNERWLRYMWQHPEIHGLNVLDYANLHEFDKYGFTWIGERDNWEQNREWRIKDTLTLTHGSRMSVAAQMAGRFYDGSVVMGHLHRYNELAITKPNKEVIFGIQSYCLCELEPLYMLHPNWQLGVLLITVYDSGQLAFENVPFCTGTGGLTAIWRGKMYTEK